MKSKDLANHVQNLTYEACPYRSGVDAVIQDAQARIMGVGNDQYSVGDKQKFELVEIDKLMEMAEEETIDQINYGAMLLVRLRDPENGYNPDHLEDLEFDCLDLISNGVDQTLVIRNMRKALASASSH